MKKSKIYTKTGDQGETGLVSGSRISKADSRIALYGELDELNSRIGLSRSYLEKELRFQAIVNFLHHVQSAILDLGSNLACEAANRKNYKLPQISDEFIRDLELEIDLLDSDLPELKHFILPGGTLEAASLHVCRTCARTVERKLISFANESGEELPANSIVFLNRLSDYLFILARFVNKTLGSSEKEWIPRK